MGKKMDEKYLFVGKKLGLEESDICDFTDVGGQVALLNWMKEDFPEFEFNLRKNAISAPRKALEDVYDFLKSKEDNHE